MGIGVRTGGARTRRRRNPTLYIPGEVGLRATIWRDTPGNVYFEAATLGETAALLRAIITSNCYGQKFWLLL
jgi:hypothetical protein